MNSLVEAPLISPDFSRKFSSFLPISNILCNPTHQPQLEAHQVSPEQLLFCYRAAIKAIHATLDSKYTAFDALTATTCCHGIALIVRQILLEISHFELKEILAALKKNEALFEPAQIDKKKLEVLNQFSLPSQLIQLTQLYLLTIIKEKDLDKGWRTIKNNLKEISPVGTRLCHSLVKMLQNYFANRAAESYHAYAQATDHSGSINNLPLSFWSKYVQPDYLRVDRCGRKYAACIYSMQISLYHLMQNRAKIAIINDLRRENGEYHTSLVQLLQGSTDNFIPLNITDDLLENYNLNEPVVVFGGCTYTKTIDPKQMQEKLRPWFARFPSLVLSCDIFYPQFPKVPDDPDFNSEPIQPEEEVLKKIFEKYSSQSGFSAKDPSIFCLAHIYVASLKQVLAAASSQTKSELSESFIPNNVRTNFSHL